MNDTVFEMASKARLMIPFFNTPQSCLCGMKMDPLCLHSMVCPDPTYRGRIRPFMHSMLKNELVNICTFYLKNSQYNVLTTEPALDNYFNRQPRYATSLIQRRADICIVDEESGKSILIDCTIACPAALRYKYDKAGDAANKLVNFKIKDYNSAFQIEDESRAVIFFFAVESPGSLSIEGLKFCQLISSLTGNPDNLQLIYQRISVCMQYIRAKQILHSLNSLPRLGPQSSLPSLPNPSSPSQLTNQSHPLCPPNNSLSSNS